MPWRLLGWGFSIIGFAFSCGIVQQLILDVINTTFCRLCIISIGITLGGVGSQMLPKGASPALGHALLH